MLREVIPWSEIDPLLDHLIRQIDREIDCILMLNPGGLVPGALLAEALSVNDLHIAGIECRKDFGLDRQKTDPKLVPWPKVSVFPDNEALRGFKVLIVANAWGTGRCMSTVRSRVIGAGGIPLTAVFHYDAKRNLFSDLLPDYYAAVTSKWIVYPWEANRGKGFVLNRSAD